MKQGSLGDWPRDIPHERIDCVQAKDTYEKIDRHLVTKKDRKNVFNLRSGGRVFFTVATWVKTRALRELAEELEEYFSEELSAVDMVSMERMSS